MGIQDPQLIIFIVMAGVSVFLITLTLIGIAIRFRESLDSGNTGLTTEEAAKLHSITGLLPEDLITIKIIIAVGLGGIGCGLIFSQVSNAREFAIIIILLCALTLLVVMYAAFRLPDLILEFIYQRRMDKLNEQLIEIMNIMSLSLRSGRTFEDTLALVGVQGPFPINEEFNRVVQEVQVGGATLEDALGRLSSRLPFKDMRIFVSTMMIVKDVGGSYAEILDRTAALIRERFQLTRKCKSMTAEGRFTALAVSLAPPLVLVANMFINQDLTMKFVTHPIGILVLIVIAIMDYIGYTIISKIVKFTV